MKNLDRTLNILHKKIRAKVICNYLVGLHTNRCVCFTSGTAADELRKIDLQVVAVGDTQKLNTKTWWRYNEIAHTFGLFDATAGHLPLPMLVEIAGIMKIKLKQLPPEVILATGSGETLVCLKMAFPDTKFTAVYNLDAHTEYNDAAPLNGLVRLLASKVEFSAGSLQK
jgi:hypothetical protein